MATKENKKPTTSEEAREILVLKKKELVKAQEDYRNLLRAEKKESQ